MGVENISLSESESFALRMGRVAKNDRGRIARDGHILSVQAVSLAGNILMTCSLPHEQTRNALHDLMEWRDIYWRHFPVQNPWDIDKLKKTRE